MNGLFMTVLFTFYTTVDMTHKVDLKHLLIFINHPEYARVDIWIIAPTHHDDSFPFSMSYELIIHHLFIHSFKAIGYKPLHEAITENREYK